MAEVLTPTAASEMLAMAAVEVPPDAIRLEARDDRWLARLPGERIAWFAAAEEGRRRLGTERRVLGLLERWCDVGAPRLIYVDPEGRFDLRHAVPGSNDHEHLRALAASDPVFARRLGASVGEVLAQQHQRIPQADASWLPARPGWPLGSDWCLEQLERVTNDAALQRDAAEVLVRYDSTLKVCPRRVLVHTDVGFHNMAVDIEHARLAGLFDWGDAACSDPTLDFRYLIYDHERYELLDAAVEGYTAAGGPPIERASVLLHNAAAAIGFLAYRAGTPPEERSCGRTLAEDLRWSRHAIGLALSPRSP